MIGLELEALIDAIADRVAERVALKLQSSSAVADQLLTVAAYASAKSISQSTVRAAIASERIDVVRSGRAVRIPAGAIIRPRAQRGESAAPATTTSAMDRAMLRLVPRGAR